MVVPAMFKINKQKFGMPQTQTNKGYYYETNLTLNNMAQTNESKNLLWSIIGKLALVLSILWILIQLYNNFFKKQDYECEAIGNHSIFEIPVHLQKTLNEYINVLAIDSALIETNNNKLIEKPISFLTKIIGNQNYQNELGIQYDVLLYKQIFEKKKDLEEYKSFWWFELTNSGNKPLEDLILELPFDGYYIINLANDKNIYGQYKHQIKIGELKTSYSVTIKVWRSDNLVFSDFEYDEEKTRFTHKYGSTEIKYPKEVSGILAWNSRNYNFPLIILIFILSLLYLIVFTLGVEYGPKITEKDNKKKLKEFEELQKLKAKEMDENRNEN
jgi:hypothetical protein